MVEKDAFYRFFANLPLNVRKEIVLDLGEDKGGPITWEIAYREIKAETELGSEILKKIDELNFLPKT